MPINDAPRCYNCAHFQPVSRSQRSGGYRPEIKLKPVAGVCGKDGERVLVESRCGEHKFRETLNVAQ